MEPAVDARRSPGPSSPRFVPRARAERTIAFGRIALAAISLLAIWVDPSSPTRFATLTYGLMAAYVTYAVGIAVVVSRVKVPHRLGMVTHGLDLALFTLFLYLTDGFASPLFVYLTFALVSAALRWRVPGVLWTAAIGLVAFNLASLFAIRAAPAGADLELNRLMIRNVYLLVITGLVAHLGAHQSRLERTLTALAVWPPMRSAELDHWLAEGLEHAAATLESTRLFLLWGGHDEPWRHVCVWSQGRLERQTETVGTLDPLVAAPLEGLAFAAADAAASGIVLVRAHSGFEVRRGPALYAGLAQRFGIRRALVAPLAGHQVSGLLIAEPGGSSVTIDSLDLVRIVANRFAVELDRHMLSGELQVAAATDARVRLVAELHDGVLQGLTASALQLRSVQQLDPPDLAEIRRRVQLAEDLIADEQRELRFLVREMRSQPLVSDQRVELVARLRELARRVGDIWDLDVRVHLAPDDVARVGALEHEVYSLAREGLMNVGRHARARSATVSIAVLDGAVSMLIADDGCGFPFRGSVELADRDREHRGPVSIRERVTRLGGTATVRSQSGGSEIEIELPLRAAQVPA